MIIQHHENCIIGQTISSTTPKKLIDDIKNRIYIETQSTPSDLLVREPKHELNLKSKQVRNLKDKNLGETHKRVS